MAELDWRHWTPKLAGFYQDLLQSHASTTTHLFRLHSTLARGLTASLSGYDITPRDLLKREGFSLDLKDAEDPDSPFDLILDEEDESEEGREEDEEEADNARPRVAGSIKSTLRRIAQKQRSDPHNRETILGFPVVGAKVGRKAKSGPILYWKVDIAFQPRTQKIQLTKQDKSPILNTALLGALTSDPTIIDLARTELIPILAQQPFTEEHLQQVIQTVEGMFELQGLMNSENRVQELRDVAGRSPAMLNHPVVLNGPRSYAFLLEDLASIARQSQIQGDSVLSQLVGDAGSEELSEPDPIDLPFQDTTDGGPPLWFPFPANRAQRGVAQKADRARILTVQGPPGTGKSRTIANLVCHLVSEGKTVLVTSHQPKALEVLTNMLTGFESIALSVLRGDKEAMSQLKTRLHDIQRAGGSVPNLTSDVERGLESLHALDRNLRSLSRRFGELRRLEHDQFSEHVKYEEVRHLDHLSPTDEPPDDDHGRLASHLQEWSALFQATSPRLNQLASLFRPHGRETPRRVEAQIAETATELLRQTEANASPIPEAATILGSQMIGAMAIDEAEALVQDFAAWVRDTVPKIRDHFDALGLTQPQSTQVVQWYEIGRRTASERIQQLLAEVRTQREFFAQSSLTGSEFTRSADGMERLRLEQAIRTLRGTGGGFFDWHLAPSNRKARKLLVEVGFPDVQRKTFDGDLSAIEQILDWTRARDNLPGLLSQVFEETAQMQPPKGQRDRRRIVAGLEQAVHLLTLLQRLKDSPHELYGTLSSASGLPVWSLAPDDLRSCEALARETRRWLGRKKITNYLRGNLGLRDEWQGRAESMLLAIESGCLTDDVSSTFAELNALLGLYPSFKRLLDLEMVELAALPASLAHLRETINEQGAVPAWLEQAETALEAHRLASLIRSSLSVHPDDLPGITKQLHQGQVKRNDMMAELIKRKRELAMAKAAKVPENNLALRKLSRLVSRKRMSDSLLVLRQSIDFSAVLKVFPAWICSIDDVARIFPMQPGLFDVLIIDEASQCNQATALPLAYRTKRMVVVGDEKQLPPTLSRFMSEANITLLQQKYGLEDHPKHIFLDGKSSLLEVAEASRSGHEFLNEHFRSDPAIIRWSNRTFYDNQLRIMTSHRPDRSRVPTEVRVLRNADDDAEQKVNETEARAVVAAIRAMIDSGEAAGQEIGVISPFRAQASLIDAMLQQEFNDDPELLTHHRLTASTADGFQGDERDIILYSFRYGPSTGAGSLTVLERDEGRRMNVAFTRARKRIICFISTPIDQFPDGFVRSFIEHARKEQNLAAQPSGGEQPDDHFDSDFERKVCLALRDRGYWVQTQVECGVYRIDLAVEDAEGRLLAVECDGTWKEDVFGMLRPEDYQRQDIIERAGWTVHRISGRRYLLDFEGEVTRVEEALSRQPTSAEEAAVMGVVLKPPRPAEVVEEEDPPTEVDFADEDFDLSIADVDDADVEEVQPSGEVNPAEAGPVESDVADSLEALLSAVSGLGSTRAEALQNLKKLVRWLVLRPRVPGRAVDSADEFTKSLEGGVILDSQIEDLKRIWDWAGQLGFEPNEVGLPLQEEPLRDGDDVLELDLFADERHKLIRDLKERGCEVEPGEDVEANGRVIGMTVASVHWNGVNLKLIASGAEAPVTRSALEAQGHTVVELQGGQIDLNRILNALGR